LLLSRSIPFHSDLPLLASALLSPKGGGGPFREIRTNLAFCVPPPRTPFFFPTLPPRLHSPAPSPLQDPRFKHGAHLVVLAPSQQTTDHIPPCKGFNSQEYLQVPLPRCHSQFPTVYTFDLKMAFPRPNSPKTSFF